MLNFSSWNVTVLLVCLFRLQKLKSEKNNNTRKDKKKIKTLEKVKSYLSCTNR